MTWSELPEPAPAPLSLMGWGRAIGRGVPVVALFLGGFVLLMLLRLIERPIFGARRPVTPHITRIVCRNALRVLGISFKVTGAPMTQRGAVVSNHASWLDIVALNAAQCVYFVSKSEVAGWPVIGLLARGVGTVFIRRNPRDAAHQKTTFETRLQDGHKLLFFPEGTSSDGRRVLPFKPTLFAAFFNHDLRDICSIQPVSLAYVAPPGEDAHFYGWWGDMDLGPHLKQVLGARRQGHIELVFHPAMRVADFADRKSLSAASELAVRDGFKRSERSAP